MTEHDDDNAARRMTDKVAALLRKAEDPAATPDEAATYAAKAHQLMDRHNLDEAMFRAKEGKAPDPIAQWSPGFDGRGAYGVARADALYFVAEACGAKCIQMNIGKEKTVTIMATASTIETLKTLLASVALQMENGAARGARTHVQWLGGSERGTAYKQFYRAFMRGYGKGVATKIKQGREHLERDAGPGAGLVLASDHTRTRAAFRDAFPRTTKQVARVWDPSGHASGYQAGLRANVGGPSLAGRSRTPVGG